MICVLLAILLDWECDYEPPLIIIRYTYLRNVRTYRVIRMSRTARMHFVRNKISKWIIYVFKCILKMLHIRVGSDHLSHPGIACWYITLIFFSCLQHTPASFTHSESSSFFIFILDRSSMHDDEDIMYNRIYIDICIKLNG